MRETVRILVARNTGDGIIEVLSPGVGWWHDPPHAGAVVGPGSRVGSLRIQNRDVALHLPEGCSGRIDGAVPHDRVVAVQYGEVLFRLRGLDVSLGSAEPVSSRAAVEDGLPEGCTAIKAPTDGVFYGRPAPDAPPFVAVGDRVHRGQAIGLVEVMKTFNQIPYDGPGLPDEAEVVEVRADDGQEIRAGAVLVVVR